MATLGERRNVRAAALVAALAWAVVLASAPSAHAQAELLVEEVPGFRADPAYPTQPLTPELFESLDNSESDFVAQGIRDGQMVGSFRPLFADDGASLVQMVMRALDGSPPGDFLVGMEESIEGADGETLDLGFPDVVAARVDGPMGPVVFAGYVASPTDGIMLVVTGGADMEGRMKVALASQLAHAPAQARDDLETSEGTDPFYLAGRLLAYVVILGGIVGLIVWSVRRKRPAGAHGALPYQYPPPPSPPPPSSAPPGGADDWRRPDV